MLLGVAAVNAQAPASCQPMVCHQLPKVLCIAYQLRILLAKSTSPLLRGCCTSPALCKCETRCSRHKHLHPRSRCAPASQTYNCVQGQLLLDEPYPLPRPQSAANLPFCTDFKSCSCCNASHSNTIERSLAAELSDTSISDACKVALRRHRCSVCDPEVRRKSVLPMLGFKSEQQKSVLVL